MNSRSATGLRGSDIFQCAYVALSYVLDRRGDNLLAKLPSPSASAQLMVSALGHPDRHHRAHSLAAGLDPIVESLDHRRLR